MLSCLPVSFLLHLTCLPHSVWFSLTFTALTIILYNKSLYGRRRQAEKPCGEGRQGGQRRRDHLTQWEEAVDLTLWPVPNIAWLSAWFCLILQAPSSTCPLLAASCLAWPQAGILPEHLLAGMCSGLPIPASWLLSCLTQWLLLQPPSTTHLFYCGNLTTLYTCIML